MRNVRFNRNLLTFCRSLVVLDAGWAAQAGYGKDIYKTLQLPEADDFTEVCALGFGTDSRSFVFGATAG